MTSNRNSNIIRQELQDKLVGVVDPDRIAAIREQYVKEMVKLGFKHTTIAASTGVGVKRLGRYLETGDTSKLAPARKFSPKEQETIIALYEQGVSPKAIAKRLESPRRPGISRDTIAKFLTDQGLYVEFIDKENLFDRQKRYWAERQAVSNHMAQDHSKVVKIAKRHIDEMVKEYRPVRTIAETLSMQKSTVEHYLETGVLKMRKYLMYGDKQFIKDKMQDGSMSPKEIADALGLDVNRIYRFVFNEKARATSGKPGKKTRQQ